MHDALDYKRVTLRFYHGRLECRTTACVLGRRIVTDLPRLPGRAGGYLTSCSVCFVI